MRPSGLKISPDGHPGGPASAVPNLFAVAAEHHDEEQRQYVATLKRLHFRFMARSSSTVCRVNVPPSLPGGPAPAVPNLFGVTTEHRDEERRQYVAASKIRFHFRLKARRPKMALRMWALRMWADLARRAIQAAHHEAAIVMSRGPAYVPPTPGSFPHRTPGGPVAVHGDTVTP